MNAWTGLVSGGLFWSGVVLVSGTVAPEGTVLTRPEQPVAINCDYARARLLESIENEDILRRQGAWVCSTDRAQKEYLVEYLCRGDYRRL